MRELYIKDDSVNHPTLSYKDRVVSVAATRAIELGHEIFGCASTGNLGNSVAAHAARLGLECYVFIPQALEPGKIVGSAVSGPEVVAIDGTYDDVNRLCTQVGDRYGWGFANINLRSYYAEGAKTYAFEIVEQLGWRFPQHLVSPVAGGTLLPRIERGFREFREVGLVDGDLPRIHAAQAAGCAPVINALRDGFEHPEPVKPDTIAKSIAIGNPGRWVPRPSHRARYRRIWRHRDRRRDPCRNCATGSHRRDLHGARRRHTLAATIRLIDDGVIPKDESIVVCITGNGYKTSDVMGDTVQRPTYLGRSLQEFEGFLADRHERRQHVSS